MKKKIDLTNIDVEKAKKESLCALPWMHIHLTPDHNIMPCCITNTENALDVVGKQEDGIDDWMNSPAMNKMRLDMLNGKKPNACNTYMFKSHIKDLETCIKSIEAYRHL